MTLVHSTYEHPGGARTTELSNVSFRDTVISCGRRRQKRASSQRVVMTPARFLRPWVILEMDAQDLSKRTDAGKRYILIVVDKVSKITSAYPLMK